RHGRKHECENKIPAWEVHPRECVCRERAEENLGEHVHYRQPSAVEQPAREDILASAGNFYTPRVGPVLEMPLLRQKGRREGCDLTVGLKGAQKREDEWHKYENRQDGQHGVAKCHPDSLSGWPLRCRQRDRASFC